MSYTPNRIRFADAANFDAFSRLRVSEPSYVFDGQLTYDLQPLLFEQVISGTGATVTHDATNRQALMTFSSTATGGKAFMQTYEHFRYQPGRSQLSFITFNFKSHVANVKKFAGYSDGNNGVELQSNGTGFQLVLYSDSTVGDQTVLQANWNVDKMTGSGPSGKTLDVSKAQILVIDFQALYVGRVRVYLDIDGILYQIHEFKNSNALAGPYIQTANLPVRCGMTCTGTVSTTMEFICSSVISEGGQEDIGGYLFSQEIAMTAASGARTHAIAIRPKTTFNSIANRSKLVLTNVYILATGSNHVFWELCLGQAISGTTTYTDHNTTYSAVEYNTAGTLSGSPSIVIASGYVAASATTKSVGSVDVDSKYPITLDVAGAVRAMGTLSLVTTGIGGSATCRIALQWRELR